MLLWVPEGTDAQYLSDLPDTIEVGYLSNTSAELPLEAGRVEFLIAPWFRDVAFFERQLSQMTSLKVIQTYSAGVDRLTGLIPPGVILCNGRGLHDTSVSEWVVGAVLSAYNKFSTYYALQAAGKYDPVSTDTLEGHTVTIFGYGSIGVAVERRLENFGVNIQRVARTGRTSSQNKLIHSFKNIGDILPTTDVLIILAPLTPETEGIVDAHFLSQLPDRALVVNAARGKLVVTDALIAELSSGRIRAILDTTDPEPIPAGHPLWKTRNVFLTQHSSGDSSDYLDKIYPFIHDQLNRYMAGEALMNIVSNGY